MRKLISYLLIFTVLTPAIFLSLQVKQVKAAVPVGVPVNDAIAQMFLKIVAKSTGSTDVTTLKGWAVYIGEQLLKIAAKRLLAQMTQATINWINSGFHGSPLFLENPDSFFKDIAKSEIRSLVDLIGYDSFRFPFGKETALNVIDSYKRQLSDNAQYTLSKVIYDPDLLVRYRNDFNYGGWNGFLINTQYPQNNYLGFDMIIQENLAARLEGTIQAPAQKVQSLLQQGMGFLSPQMCADPNTKYNNGINEFQRPSFKASKGPDNESEENYYARVAVEKADWAEKNTCKNLVATTPGSVAANQIFNALDTPRESATLAGELGNSVVDSVSAIFDALINKLLDTGLTALSGAVTDTPPEDNWSYDGQTLEGGTTSPYNPPSISDLNIPQNVSVSVVQGTSTSISGGTTPYNIIQTEASKKIASASISTSGSSGPKLTVIGITPGSTKIIIHDSSTPSKTVTVNITVNAIGALAVTPSNISTTTNSPTVASISGGEGNYSIQTGPNETIAIVILSGTNLIVTGIENGSTFVTIQDSSSPKKTVKVPITVNGSENFVIIPQDVFVAVGEETSISISGGKTPYIVTNQQNIRTATAQILPATPTKLTITGISLGKTSVTISDSSVPAKIVNINITANNNSQNDDQ